MSIADYEESTFLGCGGFGSVSLVRCRQNGRQYALKKVKVTNLNWNYLQEATMLCQLRHSNVLAYKTCFAHGDTVCIVMEYCPHGDLRQEIRRRQQRRQGFSESDIVNWTIQLCHALQYIHERNIIHRDLKPDNIFLAENNVIKIGDFGLARELQPGDYAMSAVGTPLYQSPEIVDQRSHNRKTDIYSLGCCLYELMTLQPYIMVNRMGQRTGYREMPRSGCSAALVSLVRRMLSTNPAERPDASEILQSPLVRDYANTHYISFNVCISSRQKLFVVRKDSTVKDLYAKVAAYAGEEETNFTLMLNGRELDTTKRLSDYLFEIDQQSGMLGQNLTNLVFVRRQIGGLASLRSI